MDMPTQRSKTAVPEYLQVFNSVIVLHLLEVYMSGYDPDSRVRIVDKLMGDWTHNIDSRIEGEFNNAGKMLEEHPESVTLESWGATTAEEAKELYFKALSNGKSTSSAILETTMNSILTRLEKLDKQMTEKEHE